MQICVNWVYAPKCLIRYCSFWTLTSQQYSTPKYVLSECRLFWLKRPLIVFEYCTFSGSKSWRKVLLVVLLLRRFDLRNSEELRASPLLLRGGRFNTSPGYVTHHVGIIQKIHPCFAHFTRIGMCMRLTPDHNLEYSVSNFSYRISGYTSSQICLTGCCKIHKTTESFVPWIGHRVCHGAKWRCAKCHISASRRFREGHQSWPCETSKRSPFLKMHSARFFGWLITFFVCSRFVLLRWAHRCTKRTYKDSQRHLSPFPSSMLQIKFICPGQPRPRNTYWIWLNREKYSLQSIRKMVWSCSGTIRKNTIHQRCCSAFRAILRRWWN